LRGWNAEVEVCATAGQVLDLLKTAGPTQQPFDVLLASTSLPEMSGLELAAHIRTGCPAPPASIILLNPDSLDVRRC